MIAAASNATALRAVLIGTGRMGQAVLHAAAHFARLRVVAAIAPAASRHQGCDAGQLAGLAHCGVRVSADLAGALAAADVAIDFSTGQAASLNLSACRAARIPLLIGATGYPSALEDEIDAAAREMALLVAPNTALGVAVMTELVRLAAGRLPGFDIDVLDFHHRDKRDAPSGTALALGAAAGEARLAGRRDSGERDVAFASVRAGDAAGEHTVLFSGAAEQLAISHRALDRSIYANGALAAALWLAPQPPGRYTMRDVLGLKSVT